MATRLDATGVIVTCAECKQANRIGFDRLTKTVRCGQCRAAVSLPASPVDVTESGAFETAMKNSALPLVVDFWAPWCAPCRMVAPELERVARANAGRYLIVKVNTDQLTDVAARFAIRSIPTLAVVHQGREIARVAGARSAQDIETFVQQALAGDTRRAS